MPETELKRLVAQKISINKLSSIDEIGARVNLIGTLIEKDVAGGFKNFILDDGTSHVMVGVFEEKENFMGDFEIGSSIMVIGRLRDYLGDRYVVGEIIKKIEDKNILLMRSLELKMGELKEPRNGEKIKLKIIDFVKAGDSGSGVFIEEVVKNMGRTDVESIISKMLESGELFQVRPGIVKVME
jgi:RPA family protein